VFIPRGSVVGFFTRMTLLGVAIIGVLISYAWVCDKCEGYFSGRFERLLNKSKRIRNDAASSRPTAPGIVGDARSASDARHLFSSGWFTPTLRGSVSPSDAARATGARTWRGQ
jgi:hypothetical protein